MYTRKAHDTAWDVFQAFRSRFPSPDSNIQFLFVFCFLPLPNHIGLQHYHVVSGWDLAFHVVGRPRQAFLYSLRTLFKPSSRILKSSPPAVLSRLPIVGHIFRDVSIMLSRSPLRWLSSWCSRQGYSWPLEGPEARGVALLAQGLTYFWPINWFCTLAFCYIGMLARRSNQEAALLSGSWNLARRGAQCWFKPARQCYI